jgi:radical SAM superfamily enzyme YgiQ (UPF0313 family)
VLAAINAKWIHPSYGLRLLKANLGNLENRCRIMEFTLRQGESEKTKPILAAGPRILGLSVSIWNHKAVLSLLKALHIAWDETRNPRPLFILGGPEVSWLPEDAEIFHYADYVIRGEAEDAFRELCEKLLALPQNEEKGAIPKFIESSQPDISRLVSAYHLYNDEDLKRRLIYVESSRGCVFNCDFCLSGIDPKGPGSFIQTKRLREFPLDRFFADMDTLLNRMDSGKTIKFLDRSFNVNSGRAVEILDFFLDCIKRDTHEKSDIKEGPRRQVHFEMVPFNFTSELRNALCQFPPGSLRLELGIQTLNPVAASLINRGGSSEDSLEILAFLREKTHAIVHVDLIAGLPGEDMDSFGKGLDRLWIVMTSHSGLRDMEIQVGILKLLPGAPMARHTLSHGMVYTPEPPYEVLCTSCISEAEMNRIKNFARFWELLVNRNHFPKQISRLVPPGEPVFQRFMELSDTLLGRFGRNWGIDREELRDAL